MEIYVEMEFWDVQHGHAMYVKSPNNKHIAVDLGTGSYGSKNYEFSPIKHLKYNWNVQQLDYVIITHPHLDHIDDILNFDLLSPKVFLRPKQLTNKEIMEGVQEKDRAKFEKYCEINNQYNSPINDNSSENPKNPDNFGGLKITTFAPRDCSHDNFNNHSIITVFEYAKIKVVVPGDNQRCSYDELLLNQSFRTAISNADILLAAHHGRESGYYPDFIDLVNPRLTIVSDGKFCDTSANNRYSQRSRGWEVYKKSQNKFVKRNCLTTNSDGVISVKFGYQQNGDSFLYVQIN